MSPFSKRRIYLDYASATPVREEARKAYDRVSGLVGNPGSIHQEGVEARKSLDESRRIIAAELACKPREVVFTSGLTEANNLAILGRAKCIEATPHSGQSKRLSHDDRIEASPQGDASLQGTHWVTSSTEHQSVLECFAEIERRGGKVTHIDPEPSGVLKVEKVARALRKETLLVSIGWANSEIGTVQPIRDIAAAIRSHEKSAKTNVAFHSDAGQGPLYRSPEVHTLGVDLFALGSGKLYGPRGIGALYVSARAAISPLAIGGGQERGLRAGTEAPALAAGFAAAVEAVGMERREEADRLKNLRNELARLLTEEFPQAVINGDLTAALPHILNISIPSINSEYVVLALDRSGIAISTKSACSEGRMNESHVVAALGGGKDIAESTLRISLGLDTSARDIRFFVSQLRTILKTMPISNM